MQEVQVRGNRKSKKGVVVSTKMEKTVIVKVQHTMKHPKYGKIVKRDQKLYAHNDVKTLNVGDEVEIVETRPLSKLKRWRVVA